MNSSPKVDMSSDGPTPPPCNRKIFKQGEPVAALDARSNAAERWVKSVAAKADAQVDWYYSGGIAQVLHLGNAESRARVMAAIEELAPTLDGRILNLYASGSPGLYRAGVTPVPDGALASFMGDDGNAAFIATQRRPKRRTPR